MDAGRLMSGAAVMAEHAQVKEPAPLPVRIGPAEFGLVGKLVAIRAPRELDAIFRRAGGTWEPGTRRWLVERRRIGPVIRELRKATDILYRKSGVSLVCGIVGCRGEGLTRPKSIWNRIARRRPIATLWGPGELKMAAKARPGVKTPPQRSFSLPNGDRIISLRESTLRAAVRAANSALKAESSESMGRGDRGRAKRRV
jgi:hypothetical protein